MGKLNKKQIKEIKDSKKTYFELARQFKVTPGTIRYHKSKEFREQLREYRIKRYNRMTKEEKKRLLESKRDYQRKYHREKYRSDKEYKKKQLKLSKDYQRKKYNEDKKFRKEKLENQKKYYKTKEKSR